MKRLISIFLVLLLSVCLSVQAGAEELPVWVSDDASLMTHLEALALDEQLQELFFDYGLNIGIHTTNTLKGKSPQQYADDLYDSTFGADTDGILFLLSMEDRDWYISTSGSARELLSDGEAYDSVDEILHYLSDGEYYDGFSAWAGALSWYLDNAESEPQPSIWIALAAGLAVAVIVILIMRAAMNNKRQQHSARHYLRSGSYHLRTNHNIFLYSNVTKTQKPKETSSGHTGSSGRSHGGRGGKF